MARRGRKTTEAWQEEVRRALKFLPDPIALEANSLANLSFVQRRAQTMYARRTCATGLALSSVLREILREIGADLGAEHPVSRLALMLEQGQSQEAIARVIQIRPETLTRRWKPALLLCIWHKLQEMNQESEYLKTA